MNKIKIYSFISLDGYMSKAGGDMGWISDYPHPGNGTYDFDLFYRTVSCSVVNELYYANPQLHEIYPFNGKPVHIITSNRLPVRCNSTTGSIISRPYSSAEYIEKVEKLRAGAGGDIWLAGNQDLISRFIEYGLVDEITVNVLPVTLGNGCPLLNRNGSERGWELKSHQVFDNGVVQLKYAAVKKTEREKEVANS